MSMCANDPLLREAQRVVADSYSLLAEINGLQHASQRLLSPVEPDRLEADCNDSAISVSSASDP
jgi:hypothetical protein